jgi:hypothetical protein
MLLAEAVERGRELVRSMGKNLWELGDLATEVVTLRNDAVGKDPSEVITLKEFAEQIGTSYERMHAVHWVSSSWPKEERREDVAWEVHRILVAHPNRAEIINREIPWKINELKTWLEQNPEKDTRPRGSGRRKSTTTQSTTTTTTATVVPGAQDDQSDLPPSRNRTTRSASSLGASTNALTLLREAKVTIETVRDQGVPADDAPEVSGEIDTMIDLLNDLRAKVDVTTLR